MTIYCSTRLLARRSTEMGSPPMITSCFNGTLSPSTELQIAQVYSPLIQCDGLLISVAALQQQEGANNCGIFSIAAAAMNDDVGALVFDEPKMRAHLIKCFEKGKLSRFPRTKKATPKRPAPQTIAITIIILYVQETPDSFEDMVMCDRCRISKISGITIVVRKSAKNQ